MFELPTGVRLTLGFVFTFGAFKKTYLKILGLLYQKDNNGNLLKKPKLSPFDGVSFDKIYTNISKKANQGGDNNVLSDKFITFVQSELKKYKGKVSPNKLILIEEIQFTLNPLSTNIKTFLFPKKDVKKISTRDLINFSYVLTPHIECKKAREIYLSYQEELKTRDEEEIRANICTSILPYNTKYVSDFVKSFKWSDLS